MRMINTKWTPVWLIVLSLCMSTVRIEADHLEQLRERGELTVICLPQDGIFVRALVEEYGEAGLHRFGGVDIDLLEGFAAELGLRLRVLPVPASELIPSLLDGKGDLIAGGLIITRQRATQVDFSRPYTSTAEVLVARRDSRYESLEDFAGKTAAVIPRTSHAEFLEDLRIPGVKTHEVDFILGQLVAVSDGEAEFTVLSAMSAKQLFAKFSEFTRDLLVLHTFPNAINVGFAAPKGSDLLPLLDRFIERQSEEGKLETLFARHQRKIE